MTTNGLGLESTMRVAADGYLDLSDRRRVRTPGKYDRFVEPCEEREALDFLFSHVFPNHRRIARPISVGDRRMIRLAIMADSVAERMVLADRVWRAITERVAPPPRLDRPQLIQIVTFGDHWAYRVYLDGVATRIVPHGESPPEAALPPDAHLDFRKGA